MSSKEQRHNNKPSEKLSPKSATTDFMPTAKQQTNLAAIIQQARLAPRTLTPRNMLQLQRTIGNKGVGRILIQARQNEHQADNTGTQSANGLIQRVLGPGVAEDEEVFNLLNPDDKFKIKEVDTKKGQYRLEDQQHLGEESWMRTIGYYNPQFSILPPENAPLQTELAVNKQIISKYCLPAWGGIIKSPNPPFNNANGKDPTKFEFHFNLYMKEAVRAGIEDDLLEYIGSVMLKVEESSRAKLEGLQRKRGIIKQSEKLVFGTDIKWTVPTEGDQAEILQLLHDHTMLVMPEELGTKIMGKKIQIAAGKDVGLGFHGTGRSPETVTKVHQGTKPKISLPGEWASFPDVSPFKRMDPGNIPALFRLGQKDNELYSTVSVATNFEASTDFPLLHGMDEGSPQTWAVKWKDTSDNKYHSYVAVFIVGVEKGYDTNAIQKMFGEQQVGKHGEKATGAISLGNHYGYVTYERIHEGNVREDGHKFIPMERGNLVDDKANPGLHSKIEDILKTMYVTKFHKGG